MESLQVKFHVSLSRIKTGSEARLGQGLLGFPKDLFAPSGSQEGVQHQQGHQGPTTRGPQRATSAGTHSSLPEALRLSQDKEPVFTDVCKSARGAQALPGMMGLPEPQNKASAGGKREEGPARNERERKR